MLTLRSSDLYYFCYAEIIEERTIRKELRKNGKLALNCVKGLFLGGVGQVFF